MRRFILIAVAALSAVGAWSADEAEPTEEEIKATIAALDGVVVERVTGGWMQIAMENQKFVLRFFDEKAKPEPPDVDRAVMRLVSPMQQAQRVVLHASSDGTALTHDSPLRAPHAYRVFVGLFRGESQESVESYQVGYP